jgi:3-phytase
MESAGLLGMRPYRFRTLFRMVVLFTVLLLPVASSWAMPSVPLFYSVGTPPDGRGELDSVALWVGPGAASALLFISDKTFDSVEIHDAVTNTYVGRLGTSGSGPGQMQRPNGVVVGHGFPTASGPLDILFVAERDNWRVSAWVIPYLVPLGVFGGGDVREPYGVAYHVDNGIPQIWVTSNGYSPHRVHVFDLCVDAQGVLHAPLNRWFAVSSGAVLESIVVDPVEQRVLLCDEGNFDVMVYSMQGSLLTRFGSGLFSGDTEGIAIYDTGAGSGYIVVADQESFPMEFEFFDRQTYAHIGSFTGPTTGTDGLTLTQAALPNLPNGSLFAIHNDRGLHSYDWAAIATAMGLCVNDCAPTDTAVEPTPRRGGILSSQPNPFNPSTTIHYRVAREGQVILQVFDLQGRLVRTLLDNRRVPGDHEVTWHGHDNDGRSVAAGIYFVQMQASGEVSTHKVILVK